MLSDLGGGVASVLDIQSLFFFIKENWICVMTRYHAEPNIILLIRNVSSDSEVRQWSHPLMIPLHCLWVKLNYRTRGQFEDGVTCFFLFLFRSFTCTVSLGEIQTIQTGRKFASSKCMQTFNMRPAVNSNCFEVSLQFIVSSLNVFKWILVKWLLLRVEFHFDHFDGTKIWIFHVDSKCLQSNRVA